MCLLFSVLVIFCLILDENSSIYSKKKKWCHTLTSVAVKLIKDNREVEILHVML